MKIGGLALLSLIAWSAGTAAEPLLPGRLFLTPEQRQAIDRARQERPATPEAQTGSVPFKGEIRSRRQHLRWIDDATGWQAVRSEDRTDAPRTKERQQP